MSLSKTSNSRSIARRLGLGKLKLYAYHRPISLVLESIAEGGPFEQLYTEMGRRRMVEAAQKLPQFETSLPHISARVHFLSGRKFWYQTVFCFASLQQHARFRITPVIVDDGTLGSDVRRAISRIVPWAEFVSAAEIDARLDALLPVSRYPVLRARRDEYLHLRKLTDLHIGCDDWALVLDSDMLFFRPPTALLAWFRDPSAVFMQDIGDAYGYTSQLMRELAGAPVLSRVNVGLYAVDRSRIDWDVVEGWCRAQIEREQRHYLQEQALTALILTQQCATPLPAEEYKLLPDPAEGARPTAVLHHYVAHSKRSYFRHGWRHIARELTSRERTRASGVRL